MNDNLLLGLDFSVFVLTAGKGVLVVGQGHVVRRQDNGYLTGLRGLDDPLLLFLLNILVFFLSCCGHIIVLKVGGGWTESIDLPFLTLLHHPTQSLAFSFLSGEVLALIL